MFGQGGTAIGYYAHDTCGKCYGAGKVVRSVVEKSFKGAFREVISSAEVDCDRCGGTVYLATAAKAAEQSPKQPR